MRKAGAPSEEEGGSEEGRQRPGFKAADYNTRWKSLTFSQADQKNLTMFGGKDVNTRAYGGHDLKIRFRDPLNKKRVETLANGWWAFEITAVPVLKAGPVGESEHRSALK
jgi:hypothetical protein